MSTFYFAGVDADGVVRKQRLHEELDQLPPSPYPPALEPGAGLSWYLLSGSIDWSTQPTGTSVLQWNDGSPAWVETCSLPDAIVRAVEQIDAAADAARLTVSPAGRDLEYQRAEAQAQAYKDAAYTGPVPPCVDSWARAKQWTARNAAIDILATAARWYPAVEIIRDLRLNAKENVRRVTEAAADVEAIVAQFMTDLSTLMKGLA